MALSTGTLKVMSWSVGAMGVVRTFKGWKMGRSISLMLGQELGTTKFWFRAEKANSRVARVRKGFEEGIRLLKLR